MAHGHRSVSNTTTTLNDLTTNTSVIQQGHAVTTGPFQMIRYGFGLFHGPAEYLQPVRQYRLRPSSVHRHPDYQLPGRARAHLDSTSTRTSYESDNFVFTHANFDYTHTILKRITKS
jgi:hypothetical protein